MRNMYVQLHAAMKNINPRITKITSNKSAINVLSSTFLKRAPRNTTSTKLPLIVPSNRFAKCARHVSTTEQYTVHGSKINTETKSCKISTCITGANAIPVLRARSTETYQNAPGLNLKNKKAIACKKLVSLRAKSLGNNSHNDANRGHKSDRNTARRSTHQKPVPVLQAGSTHYLRKCRHSGPAIRMRLAALMVATTEM